MVVKRWQKIISGLLLALALIMAPVIWLLVTTAGATWVLNKVVPDIDSVNTQVSGNFISGLSIPSLAFAQTDINISLNSLTLRFSPSCALVVVCSADLAWQDAELNLEAASINISGLAANLAWSPGTLVTLSLSGDRLQSRVFSADPDMSNASINLPEWLSYSLPDQVPAVLQNIHLTRFQFNEINWSADSPGLRDVIVSALIQPGGLEIERAGVEWDNNHVELQGHWRPDSSSLPVYLAGRVHNSQFPGGVEFEVTGGPDELSAVLADELVSLNWRPGPAGQLELSLGSDKKLRQFLSNAELNPQSDQNSVSLPAWLSWQEARLALEGHAGELKLNLLVNGSLYGDQVVISADGSADLYELRLQDLAMKYLESSASDSSAVIAASGLVAFRSDYPGRLDLQVRKLRLPENPANIDHLDSGSIHLSLMGLNMESWQVDTLNFTGTVAVPASSPMQEPDLKQGPDNLSDQKTRLSLPVTFSGQGRLHPDGSWQIESARIKQEGAENHLIIAGSQLAGALNFAIREPDQLIPELTGELQGEINWQADSLKLNATLSNFNYMQYSVAAASFSGEKSADAEKASFMELTAGSIQVDQQVWSGLKMRISGQPTDHQFDMALTGSQAVTFAGNGQWQETKGLWQAVLTDGSIYSDLAGQWLLSSEPELSFATGNNEFIAGPQCWLQDTQSICLTKASVGEAVNLEAQLANIQLQQFPWPEDISVKGTISGDLSYAQPSGGIPDLQWNLKEDGPIYVLQTNRQQTIEQLQFSGQWYNQLAADLTLNDPELGQLQTTLEANGINLDSGSVTLKSKNFNPGKIVGFTPSAGSSRGLNTDIRLEWQNRQPMTLTGSADWHPDQPWSLYDNQILVTGIQLRADAAGQTDLIFNTRLNDKPRQFALATKWTRTDQQIRFEHQLKIDQSPELALNSALIFSDNQILLQLSPDRTGLKNSWQLAGRAGVVFNDGIAQLQRPLCFASDGQKLCLERFGSDPFEQQIALNWNNIQLQTFNPLIPVEQGLQGEASGTLKWQQKTGQVAQLSLDMNVENPQYDSQLYGWQKIADQLTLSAQVSEQWQLQVTGTGPDQGKLDVTVGQAEQRLEINAEWSDYPLSWLALWQPSLSGLVADSSGSGQFVVENGTVRWPRLSATVDQLVWPLSLQTNIQAEQLRINGQNSALELSGRITTPYGAVENQSTLDLSSGLTLQVELLGDNLIWNNQSFRSLAILWQDQSLFVEVDTSVFRTQLSGPLWFENKNDNDNPNNSSDPQITWQPQLAEFTETTSQRQWTPDKSWQISWLSAPGQLQITSHCWTASESRVCLEETALFGTGAGQFALNWSTMPMPGQWFWGMPSAEFDLVSDGRLQGNWLPGQVLNAEINAGLTGRARLDITQDWISVKGKIEGQKTNQLDVSAELDLDKMGKVAIQLQNGQFSHPYFNELTLFTEDMDLSIFELWAQDSQLAGRLDMALKLNTNEAGKYQADGFTLLKNGLVQPGTLPVRLTASTLTLDASDSSWRVDGRLAVNDQPGDLNISLVLAPKGWRIDADYQVKSVPINDAGLSALVDVDLNLIAEPSAAQLTGDILVQKSSWQWQENSISRVNLSDDVIRVEPERGSEPGLVYPLSVELNIRLGDDVYFEGFGLRSNLEGELIYRSAESGVNRLFGQVRLYNGRFRAYGSRLNITRGNINFTGQPGLPIVDLQAERQILDVTAGVKVTGTLDDPQVELISDPTLSQAQILSYIIRGQAITGNALAEGLFLTQLAIGGNAESPVSKVGEQLGISDLSIGTESTDTETQLAVTGYITPRLYLKYGIGFSGQENQFTMRYQLTPELLLQSTYGLQRALDLLYSRQVNFD